MPQKKKMGFLILVFLFVAVPIAEISLLLNVGGAIGGFNTILFVIFTAVLGAYLVRQQGFATLVKLQEEANAGRVPALQMAEGVALLFAGAVLLTPGFITDAIGFTLLVPFLRRTIIALLVAGYRKRRGSAFNHANGTDRSAHQSDTQSSAGPTIIEGEYRDPNEDK